MSGLYVVERIIGKRIRDGKNVEFKVKWKGFDSSQSTWEPIRNLKNVDYMIDQFEQRNKDKLPQNTKLAPENKPTKLGAVLQKKIQTKNGNNRLPAKIQPEKPIKKKYDRPVRRTEEKSFSRKRDRAYDINEEEQMQSAKEEQREDHIVIDSAGQTQQNEEIHQNHHEQNQEEVQEIDLDNIANRIMEAMIQKQKKVAIVGVIKRTPEQGIVYVTEDSDGNRQIKQRQFVLQNLSAELIAFYESQLNQHTE